MLATSTRLLVRAEPNADESFGSYIVRLTELNFYDIPFRILKLAGIERKFLDGGYSFLFRKSFDFSSLARLTDTDVAKLLPLTHPPVFERKDSKNTSVFGLPIRKNFIRIRFPKICLECLKESPYGRKIWDISPVTACPVHRILLLDECPNCNKRLSWNRNQATYCRCGFSLLNATPVEVDETELALARRIYQLCGFQQLDNRSFSELSDSPILSLDLEHLLRAVYFIARQHKGDVHRNGGYFAALRNIELHSLLVQSFSVFTRWPDNFHNFLARVRRQENSPVFNGLLKDFGYFYRTLYVNVHSKQFDFMRDEFEEYVYKNCYGRWVFSKNRLNGKSKYRRKYLSKANAMQQLGLHQRCINRLIKLGKFEIKESSKRGKTGILIEAESVARFRIALRQSLTLTDAAKLLGIKNERVIDLAKQDYIDALRGPSVDGSQAWRFTRESINELLSSLYNLCSPTCSIDSQELISFHSALRMFVRCDLETSTFIRAILDKKLTPYRNAGEVGIDCLLFCRAQLYEYAQSLRQIKRGGYYCIKDLMKVLGFKTNRPILFLVRKGIIKAQKDKGAHSREWLIGQEDVDSFKAKFVLPAQLATKLETSGSFLSALLITKGVKPVSGPQVDDGPQYIFRKTDLEGINLSDLVSEARLDEKRKNKKITVIDSNIAKKILGVDSKALSQLVECGVLDPSRTNQDKQGSKYLFNFFHVERLKNSSIEYLNLISLPQAAKMLNETYSAFRTNWIRSGHLKLANRYNDKNYLCLTDVKALVKLRGKALTIIAAAKALNATPKTVMRFVAAGRLKLIRKSTPRDGGRTLFWRKDVEKLRISIQP